MDLVKMSAKGQLVVPDGIRIKAKFKPGDRFIAVSVDEGVLFRKSSIQKEYEELRKVFKNVQREVKKRKIPQSVVAEAIRWARKN